MENTNAANAEAANVESQTSAEVADTVLISTPPESSALDSELPPASLCPDDNTNSSDVLPECETPKENIFNPFSPASDNFAVAPMKKVSREFRLPACCKLDFENCVNPIEEIVQFSADDDDELILESLCQSFLDLIIANQSQIIFESTDEQLNGHTTPPAAPRLTGVAECCPDAPARPGPKSRMPQFESGQTMCRKLDFESC